MNKTQFLLMKLAEECAEVSQRAIKQIQFGKSETQTGQAKTNAQRLREELLDLWSIVKLLQINEEFQPIYDMDILRALIDKREKLNKYLKLSADLNQLPEMTI